MGAAGPLDMTNLSEAGSLGSETLYFITLKKRTDMISAALQQDVGCPELLAFVAWMLEIRSLFAISLRAWIVAASGL